MRLPEFGVRFPVTNIMIFSAIIVLGLFSLLRLPIDLMPEIEPPSISVITVYEGAGAEDVETKVTEVIENNLATVSNLDKLTSRSFEAISVVTCRFNWGTNLDEASNDIRDKLEFAKRSLPDEIETPIVFKFNTANIPILFIGASAVESYPKLFHLIDKQVADYLKRIPGVGAVQIIGGLERQINIKIDRSRLEGHHLSIQSIVEKLAAENVTLPAGDLKMGFSDYTLRVPGEFTGVSEMGNIIVGQLDNKIIYLKDIAEAEDSFKEETMIVRNNGQPGLMLLVQKRSGANTVEVAKKVKKGLIAVQKFLPKDVRLYLLMDTSEHITRSINNLSQTVYWGGLFVIIVVYLFLRQLKASMIIAFTIPFSLIIAFIFMFAFKYTINIMSLSSLAIAIGMVVDNAIVIVDNISRHRQLGEGVKEAAIGGASEVGLAVSASTLTTVVVFLPMIFLSGIVGIMFQQLAVLITVTLIASLFTALTFSPMLCAKLFPQKFAIQEGKIFTGVESRYGKMLSWSLKHKKAVIFIALGLFLTSIFLIPRIGTEFVPEEDTGDLNVQVELPVGTRVEETDKSSRQLEAIFRKEIPEMRQMFSRSGQSSGSRLGVAFGRRPGSNVMQVGAKLVKVEERRRSIKEIAEAIRPKIMKLPGVKRLSIQAGSPFSRLLFGGEKPVSIEILGHDLIQTDELAYKIKRQIQDIPGLVDAVISRELGKPELQIEVDRTKASSLGLTMAKITESMRFYFEGTAATKFREAGDEYDILVRLKESDRQSIEDIKNISFVSNSGQLVKLSNIARIAHRTGPIEIARQNQERIIKVEANVFRRSLGEVAKDINKVISSLPIPEEITVKLGSDVEEQAKSFRDLILIFLLGGLLVYMVMAAQFESLLDPFVIMFSLPFALCGVVFGLLLTKTTLNTISFLGLVMLAGIVVNNAIVLVSYINILRSRGAALDEAIAKAGTNRLRPVLMTTLTTLLGMLPLAISRGQGSELWRPLGISIISGLSLSTLVTLILVPVLYAVFEKRSFSA